MGGHTHGVLLKRGMQAIRGEGGGQIHRGAPLAWLGLTSG